MRGQASFAEAREVAAAWEALIAQHPGFAPAYPPLTRLYNTDYCFSGLGSTGADGTRDWRPAKSTSPCCRDRASERSTDFVKFASDHAIPTRRFQAQRLFLCRKSR